MIRQLPKLSLPSFMSKDADKSASPDIKIYDIITAATQTNSEGNTMQLQLFQKDSEVNDNVRELHGKLVLNTTQLPDKQDLKFGFMFSDDPSSAKYDGLQLTTQIDHQNQKASFKYSDIYSSEKPSVFALKNESGQIMKDEQNDWVVSKEGPGIVCEDVGRCTLSINFVRNFNTLDDNDIALEVGEEREYSVVGFYEAKDFSSGGVTHVGQSNDMYVVAGAFSSLSYSALAVATAIFSLSAF